MPKPSAPSKPRILNKRATHDFEILEQIEAGIALTGSEVKSLRSGKASLTEAFAMIRDNQAFLRQFHIEPYPHATGKHAHEPTRERILLLHKREILKLHAKLTQKGLTLVPLRVEFNERGRAKVVLGVARGKKLHDKRQDLKKRDIQRDMAREARR